MNFALSFDFECLSICIYVQFSGPLDATDSLHTVIDELYFNNKEYRVIQSDLMKSVVSSAGSGCFYKPPNFNEIFRSIEEKDPKTICQKLNEHLLPSVKHLKLSTRVSLAKFGFLIRKQLLHLAICQANCLEVKFCSYNLNF